MRGSRFLRDQRGSTAAEFAIIMPLFLLFLLGMIDVGRYAWAINQERKAVQVGARWAVVTDMVPTGLASYDYATDGGLTQGDPIPQSAFPGVQCSSTGSSVSCSCWPGGICTFPNTVGAAGSTNFQSMTARMRAIYQPVEANNVQIDYAFSGLGFAGDPNGPDVSPLVTVRIVNQQFPLLFLLGRTVPLPVATYTLTMEDGQGTVANY